MKLMHSLYNFYCPILMFLDYLKNCENHSSLCHWCMSKKWSGPIDFLRLKGWFLTYLVLMLFVDAMMISLCMEYNVHHILFFNAFFSQMKFVTSNYFYFCFSIFSCCTKSGNQLQ
jgi:hypothetical protein